MNSSIFCSSYFINRHYRLLILLAHFLILSARADVALSFDAPRLSQENKEEAVQIINENESLNASLRPGGAGIYRFRLAKDYSANIVLSEFTYPVEISVMNVAHELIVQTVGLDGEHGPRRVNVVAQVSGDFLVKIKFVDESLSGNYRISLQEIRRATQGDRQVVKALALWMQARQFQEKGDAESMEKAIDIYKGALTLLENTDDRISEASASSELGALYFRLGAFAEAEPLLERTLEIRKKVLGADALDTSAALNDLGLAVRLNGKLDRSEGLLNQALVIREKALTPAHPDIAETLNNLAGLMRVMGQAKKSEEFYKRSLAIREKVFGPAHQSVAESLNNLALLYESEGMLAKAEPLYRRALFIYENTLGPKNPDFATVNNNLGMWYKQQGDYERAKQYLERALSIRKAALGAESSYAAESYNNLACVYADQGALEQAEKLYLESLRIYESAGSKDPQIVDVLNNLGCLYMEMRKYSRANAMLQRATSILESLYGIESPDFAYSLNVLAGIYLDRGFYDKAQELIDRGVAIAEKISAPKELLGTLLHDLAVTYFYRGDYDRAEKLQQRALSLRQEAFGPENREVASTLHDLAVVYEHRGDYRKSDQLHQRALAILEKTIGPDHPLIALELHDFGVLYEARGDYKSAENHYSRAFAMREKVLSPEHPQLAMSLNVAGVMFTAKGDYAKAEEFLRRALLIREKALGPEHGYVAQTLLNLARLYRAKHEYERAEDTYERGLDIYRKAVGPINGAIGDTLYDVAELNYEMKKFDRAEDLFNQSLSMYEKALGPEHPFVASPLAGLAAIYEMKGDIARAAVTLKRALQITENSLNLNLVVGSEQQKYLYLRKVSSETDRAISLNIRAGAGTPDAARTAVTTIIRRKGRALDVMANSIGTLRRHADPEDRTLLDQLATAQTVYSTAAHSRSRRAEPSEYQHQLQTLYEKVEKLEAEVSERSAQFRSLSQDATLEEVQQVIPVNAALVEFVLYRPYTPEINSFGESRYVAYVIFREGVPRWVDLGEARPIDSLIALTRNALRDPKSTAVKSLARNLEDKIMRRVRALLGKKRDVLISPDGQLNLVPFSALIDENNHYLVENYSFISLTSGRDLLRLRDPGDRQSSEQVIVANPLFDLAAKPVTPSNVVATKSTEENDGPPERSVDFAAVNYKLLPGTAAEAAALQSLFPSARVLAEETATEAALKKVQDPQFLHIATHGFFLSDQPRDSRAGNTPSRETSDVPGGGEPLPPGWENPLLRSGLVLAGVKQGHSGTGEDGVLTSLESAGLNLWGTKLVVLSACETGLGGVRNGEGVYGLRRALVLAGSETQVISLWKVSDAGTRDLMTAYYTRLGRGEGRAEALRQVQLEMLGGRLLPKVSSMKRETIDDTEKTAPKDYRHPYYWAAFIQSGDWRSMDGK